MKDESISRMKEVIDAWKQVPLFSTVQKECMPYQSSIVPGEYMLYFKISHHSFLCDGNLIPLELTSDAFLTNTLSPNPLSQNVNSDAYNLKGFLEKFDKQFADYRKAQLGSCTGKLETTDLSLLL